MFTAASFTVAKRGKQPSVHGRQWTDKVWSTHTRNMIQLKEEGNPDM